MLRCLPVGPGIEAVKDGLCIINMKACLEKYSLPISVFHRRMTNIYVISVSVSLAQMTFFQCLMVGYVPGLAAVALLPLRHQAIMTLLATTISEFFHEELIAINNSMILIMRPERYREVQGVTDKKF
ncbi:hypothetical protein [Desulfopila sp. IMCC35008]|uniref:hypothetical protein n=1 Tax=Desulfopila sp. IMCC35008 TaxID=2653858 RepID=UPI0013D82E23|nr:hypothetical protein [Desulfopila sp. IMCC35008]